MDFSSLDYHLHRNLLNKVFDLLRKGFKKGDIFLFWKAGHNKNFAHDVKDGKLLFNAWSISFEFLL